MRAGPKFQQPQDPVELPERYAHGGSTAYHAPYRCRCEKCLAWRRAYDRDYAELRYGADHLDEARRARKRYKVGDRVRLTVDTPAVARGGFSFPVGSAGVVTDVHTTSDGRGYAVLLDQDVHRLPAYYESSELEEES